MPTTENLNLKKPLSTDNYNVEDQNSNMDILDAIIASLGLRLTDIDKVDSAYLFGSNQRGTLSFTGDLDSILKSGFYFATAASNRPVGINGFVLHMQLDSADTGAVQLYAVPSASDFYKRNKNAGVWGAWAKVWTGDNDGSGSGLDADTLRGKTPPAGTIVGTTDAQTLTNKTLNTPVITSISNGGTITIPVGNLTLATLTGTETLTNKTLTAAKIASAGYIADANGNEILKVRTVVASAVNEITIGNNTTGNAPYLEASGGDTNIDLNLKSKGTGAVQVNGVEIASTTSTQTLTNKTIVTPNLDIDMGAKSYDILIAEKHEYKSLYTNNYGSLDSTYRDIMAVDATHIFVASGNYVLKFDKYTGLQVASTADYGGLVKAVAVDDTYVFFGGSTTKKIRRVLKSTMASPLDSIVHGGNIMCIALDSTSVYFGSADGFVHKAPKTTLTDSATYSTGSSIWFLHVDGTHLYVDRSTYVARVLLSTLAYVDATPGYGNSIKSVTTDASYVYVCGLNANVVKYNKTTLASVATSPNLGGTVSAITCDGTYVYVIAGSSSNCIKLLAANLSVLLTSTDTAAANALLLYDGLLYTNPRTFPLVAISALYGGVQ